jgi:hypothetical protein
MNIKIVLQLVMILLLTLGATHARGQDAYVVDAGVLNVRACPDVACQVLGTVKQGQQLEVLAREGNWYKIRLNNQTGYVSRKYVKTGDEIKNSRERQVKKPGTWEPLLFETLSKILPVKSLLTWVITLSLAVMLYFLYWYFNFLDQRFIELLGSTKEGGKGWPLVVSGLAGILFAAAVLWNGKEAGWFLAHGIALIPSCHTAVHWMIFISAVMVIMTLLGVLVESFFRLSPLYAPLRFLILAFICGITYFVAFYLTILLVFIIILIIILSIGLAVLSSMAYERTVYYYD